MPDVIRTRIHSFAFNLKVPAEKAAWKALKDQLAPTHPHPMRAYEGTRGFERDVIAPLDGREIELETRFLFDNQWNTAPIPGISEEGLRVFDWHIALQFGLDHIRLGHWLEQTDEMRELRRNTMTCGYCGKQEPAAKGYVFCPHCLDSEHLGESDLFLTRMRAVEDTGPGRKLPPLTDAERAYLLPLYREAQLHGSTERGRKRIAKMRADIIAKCDHETKAAVTERDGFLWLMDHGVGAGMVANCIYYKHTGKFCFGWRKPLGKIEAHGFGGLVEILQGFPFEFEIKEEPEHRS